MSKNVRRFVVSIILSFAACVVYAQSVNKQVTVSGTITDENGKALSGVSVVVSGAGAGSISNTQGQYNIELTPGTYQINFSSVGYNAITREVATGESDQLINITLVEAAVSLNELVILGSRAATARTNIDKPVPVDVIMTKDLSNFAQTDVTQMLNYAAPAFNSNRQTVSDGTDHIDPASLRGLGTDQVLVLVNGKRRHSTALVNINGTFGRGSVGTDMNSIPVAAIERIEVLRDGAAAQYGSDAIAGVINIVLKKKSSLTLSSTYGQSLSHSLGTDFNDGQTFQFDASKGFQLGSKGSINIAGQFLSRAATNRGGPDTRPLLYSSLPTRGANESEESFRQRYAQLKAADDEKANNAGLDRNTMLVGNSRSVNGGVFVNAQYNLTPKMEAYLVSGYSDRDGKAAGFYRLPSQSLQIDLTLYPNGFLPFINTTIRDFSLIAGIRGGAGKWNYDISNTYGKNSIGLDITNTLNASLPAGTSPTIFHAGDLSFSQNTINLDVARSFDFRNSIIRSLNMGYGAEFRVDNYQIAAGEELSYSLGQPSRDIDPVPGKAAGAQVFPGFTPTNALNKSRNNTGLYADFEGEVGRRVLLGAAGRFENYSDFGSNFSYKVTGRVKIYKEIAIRGSISTGFRAPSLHQRYFNNISTQFVQGAPTQVLTVNNDSDVVRQFGVGSLKAEISKSQSLGIAGELFDTFNFSIDAYQIDIDNRIVFSSQYARERDANAQPIPTGAVNQILNPVDKSALINSVQFFTNAISTRTRGLDVVLSKKIDVGSGSFNMTVAGNLNRTEVREINGTDVIESNPSLKGRLFDRLERSRYESSIPKNKLTIGANYSLKRWAFLLRTVRFGEVTFRNAVDPTNTANNLPLDIDQTFSAKWITDVSVTHTIFRGLSLTLGANNLFDVYPDKAYIDPRNNQFNLSGDPSANYTTARDNTSNGHFLYSRNVSQFGFNGRYVFAKLSFQL